MSQHYKLKSIYEFLLILHKIEIIGIVVTHTWWLLTNKSSPFHSSINAFNLTASPVEAASISAISVSFSASNVYNILRFGRGGG